MRQSGVLQRKSVSSVGAAIFGVLAAVISTARLELPFPILPYLKFDFGEVPVVLAFLLFGPIAGLLTAAVHWLFLAARSGILGPALKFAAVVSMLTGMWLGAKLAQHSNGGSAVAPKGGLAAIFGVAIGVRVIMLTLVNYGVLVYIAPVFFGQDYLNFAAVTLRSTLGLTFAEATPLLAYTLIYTGLYNLLHVLFSGFASWAILVPLRANVPEVRAGGAWIDRIIRWH